MILPPIHPLLALPVVGVCASFGAINRALANVGTVDGNTLIPIGLAVVAIITIGGWIFWYATDRANTRNEMRAQQNLLRYLCRKLPQIDDEHGEAKRLLIELESAQKESKSRPRRDR